MFFLFQVIKLLEIRKTTTIYLLFRNIHQVLNNNIGSIVKMIFVAQSASPNMYSENLKHNLTRYVNSERDWTQFLLEAMFTPPQFL